MIRHVVIWRFEDGPAKEFNLRKARELLTTMAGRIPGLLSVEVVINRLPGEEAADLKQKFTFFGYEMALDFSMDTAGRLDRRLGVAAAALLAIIEGKQKS